jgi:hypothetical protein
VFGESVIIGTYLDGIVTCHFQASSDQLALQQRQIALEGRGKNIGLCTRRDTHLSCEHASIKPQIAGDFNQLEIGGTFWPILYSRYLDEVSRNERSSRKGRLGAITDSRRTTTSSGSITAQRVGTADISLNKKPGNGRKDFAEFTHASSPHASRALLHPAHPATAATILRNLRLHPAMATTIMRNFPTFCTLPKNWLKNLVL